MNLILTTILQEKKRIDMMLQKYQEQLQMLPKGTLSEKKVHGNTYYYLKYRDGQKIISRYVRQTELEDVREQITKRRHIEAIIRSLKEEESIANKALEGYV